MWGLGDDFDTALGELSKCYAAEHLLTFHQAYAEVLETPKGSQLYVGYLGAPPALPNVVKAAPDDEEKSPTLAKITKAASLYEGRGLTKEAAIAKVLGDDPSLYTAYLAERQ